jgi:hypothetical protein
MVAGREVADTLESAQETGDGGVDLNTATAEESKEQLAAASLVGVGSTQTSPYYYPPYSPWGGGYRWGGGSLMGAVRGYLPF